MSVQKVLSVADCVNPARSSAEGREFFEIPVLPHHFNPATHFIDRHLAEGRADKIAIIDDQGSHPYRELAGRVNRLGNVLKSLGVEQEHRVLICLSDGADFAAAFFGAVKIGAVPLPVNPVLTSADFEYMLADSRARVAVVSASVAERFCSIKPGPPSLKAIVIAGPTGPSQVPAGCLGLDALEAAASDRLDAAETLADEFGLLLYTTGSTGRPKGVMHRHSDMFHTALAYADHIPRICPDDVSFSSVKMWGAMGLGCSVTFPLHAGATAVLMAARATPETVMEVMRRHQPTVFWGVPTLYNAILANPAYNRSTGSGRLRFCVTSGEMLPEKVFDLWKERFGVCLTNCVGSTEALHIYLSRGAGEADYRGGSVGKPVPGYEVRALGEEGGDVAPGEVGDLWVSGPSVSPGYLNNRAATTKGFAGRWHFTGDRVTRDADGYYCVAGRADDMLRVGANWVSPMEVEACLTAHPDVAEAAVVGAPDADGLVKPKGFVVLRQGVSATPELAQELKEFVKGRLAPFKYPRWIEFRSELPKTARGKIQRFRLRQESGGPGGHGGPPH